MVDENKEETEKQENKNSGVDPEFWRVVGRSISDVAYDVCAVCIAGETLIIID